MNRIEFIGNTLFIPIFLISVGMLVNPAALAGDRHTWMVAASMTIAVVVTKYLAARISAALFHYDGSKARVMFGLSVVQAAATLAAVMVGYDLGIFDDSVLNGTIVMIMITCPLGSWFVDRFGRQMAAGLAAQEPVVQTEQRLLVPVANPDSAIRLLDLAFILRDDALPGVISPVTIVEETAETELAVAGGEKLLAHCLAHAAAVEIPVSPGVRVGMNVVDGIVRAAKEMRAGLVIAGWNGGKACRPGSSAL
jgi:hypothetical protein